MNFRTLKYVLLIMGMAAAIPLSFLYSQANQSGSFVQIDGGTTGQTIGNLTDRLKVIDNDVINTLLGLGGTSGFGVANVFRFNEVPVTSRNEFDLSGSTYVVPVGKTFAVTVFTGSYSSQAALYVRLKKQTGGTGPFLTILRMNMMAGGQGDSTLSLNLSNGVIVGSANDVFKITIESSIAKGTIQAAFAGVSF